MAELDFAQASVEEVSQAYFRDGCVLLRNFVDPARLHRLIEFVDGLYDGIEGRHVFPFHLEERHLPPFHEHVFDAKHHALLTQVFAGAEYVVSPNTATRRVQTGQGGGHWQAPLGPHLDSFFHHFQFTVNFWVPFRDCGVSAPSLGVVCCPFDDILAYAGCDEPSEANRGPRHEDHPGWNFDKFGKQMYALALDDEAAIADFRRHFADRIWTPTYAFGDAMMSSNWTLHFTHAAPAMTEARGNIELRFYSAHTLASIRAAHRAAAQAATAPGP